MKKINKKTILIVILLLTFSYVFSQLKVPVKYIKIEYIDFTVLTDVDIYCDTFEQGLSYNTILIKDVRSIEKFMCDFYKAQKDTIKDYHLDVRCKIIVFYNKNQIDTICLSRFGYCYNNSVVFKDDKFIDFVGRFIRERDNHFVYK